MSEKGGASQAPAASWWIAAVAFFSGIGGGVVFPILPMLGQQLGLAAAMVGLILAANRIVRVFFNPVTGWLVDRFGSRLPVAAGLFVEAIAVIAFSVGIFAHAHAWWFLAGRALWGVGSSLILIGTLAAVMAISSHGNRGRLTGRVRTAITLGIPGGMLLGGLVADLASPNAAFLCAAGITLATGILALFVLPRRADTHEPAGPDARAEPVAPSRPWAMLLRNPLLQVVWCGNALVFFAVSGVLLSTLVVLVHALHVAVFGLESAGTAGLLMAWMMLFRGAAALATGSILDRSTRRTVVLVPAALITAAIFFADASWTLALCLMVIGLGSGALTIPLLTLLSDLAPAQAQGRATSVYQVYGDIGGSAGPIVGLQLGAMFGYGLIYLGVAAALLLAMAPLYWLVRREHALVLNAGARATAGAD